MTTYTVLFAEDVPHYGFADIEADNAQDAIAKAKAYWEEHAEYTPTDDPDWNNTVCQRIVSISAGDQVEITRDIRLDDHYLGMASDAELRVRDAAPRLLAALKDAHAQVLELARERDPDQLGLWDAIFTSAKAAITQADGKDWPCPLAPGPVNPEKSRKQVGHRAQGETAQDPVKLAKALTPWWMMEIRKFDGLEIHPVQEFTDQNDGSRYCEQCEPSEAQFWSVYGHLKEGGVLCIEDFATEAEGRAFARTLLDTYAHLRTYGLFG